EADWPSRERAFLFAGIHRSEAVAAQQGQPRGAHAGRRRAPDARPAADVEVKPIADDQAAAPGRLDVAPVPVAVLLRNGDEGSMVGPVPVEAVAAEADADLVGLGPIVRLPAPDGE